jgi:hypothetical protein
MARTAGVEPVYYNERVSSHAAQRVFAEGEVARASARRLVEANVYRLLDVGYAEGAKNLAVGEAQAESDYWVGFFGLDEGQSDATLAQARTVALADAALAFATKKADADLEWTSGRAAVPPSTDDPDGEPAVAGIVAGDWELAEGRATGWRNLQISLSDIARDTIIGCTGPIETQTNSYAAAQVAFWNAEVGAASARNTAEANALADFRTADYAQTASAVAGIHTAINLPWTDYQADLAAALSTWWVNAERGNFLALAGAVNAAETAYQTTVNAAFLAWASGTAAAERAFVTAQANADYSRAERDLDANRDYERALGEAERLWQINYATARRTHNVAVATNERTFAINADAAALAAANAAAAEARVVTERTGTQQYTIAEANAHGTMATLRAGSDCTGTGDLNAASLTYVTSTANADADYAIAESNANYTRLAAIALAEKNYDLAHVWSLEDALDTLATASASPWAIYDVDVAAADEVFTNAVAPARYDYFIQLADADRDLEIAIAQAVSTRRVSLELADGTRRLTYATANQTRTLAEVLADIGISENIPILNLGPIRSDSSNNTTNLGPVILAAPSEGDRPANPPAAPQPSPATSATPVTSANSGDTTPGELPSDGDENGMVNAKAIKEAAELPKEVRFNPLQIPPARVSAMIKADRAIPIVFGEKGSSYLPQREYAVVVDQIGDYVVVRVLEKYTVTSPQSEVNGQFAWHVWDETVEYYRVVSEKWFATSAIGGAHSAEELMQLLKSKSRVDREARSARESHVRVPATGVRLPVGSVYEHGIGLQRRTICGRHDCLGRRYRILHGAWSRRQGRKSGYDCPPRRRGCRRGDCGRPRWPRRDGPH